MIVGQATALFPIIIPGTSDAAPADEPAHAQLGPLVPMPDEVDNFIAQLRGDPAGVQRSPESFFASMSASTASLKTSFFLASLASSCSIPGFLGINATFVPDRGEGDAAFLKELVLPGVKLGGRDAVFGADFGDRFLFEEVKAQDSDFVFGAVSFTLLFGHVDGLDVRSIPLIQSGCCPIPTEAGQPLFCVR